MNKRQAKKAYRKTCKLVRECATSSLTAREFRGMVRHMRRHDRERTFIDRGRPGVIVDDWNLIWEED